MKKRTGRSTGKTLGRAMLVVACGIFAASAAYGQGCAVNQIRVRIGTAEQNALPGGANNLDIEIHFKSGAIQKASDVNGNYPWAINSQNVVTIPLKQTVPVSEIKRIRLIYNMSAGEWDMSFLRARAIGSAWNGIIAKWGPPPPPIPYHRFNATYPAFGVDTMPNACSASLSSRMVMGPVRVAPGTPVQRTGPLMNAGAQQTMLGAQARPLMADGNKSSLPAVERQAITDGTLTGGLQPAGVPQIGASQTMSATQSGANSTADVTQVNPAPTGGVATKSGVALHGNAAPTQPGTSVRKFAGRNEYDAITTDRGVTHDTKFQQWANTSATACAKDPTFRILKVTGLSNRLGVVFVPSGGQYTIWGCSCRRSQSSI